MLEYFGYQLLVLLSSLITVFVFSTYLVTEVDVKVIAEHWLQRPIQIHVSEFFLEGFLGGLS